MSMKAGLSTVLPAVLAMPPRGEEFMELSRVIKGHELRFWQLACPMVHLQQHSSGKAHATLKSLTSGANSFYVRCSMMRALLFWITQLFTNRKQPANSLKTKAQSYSFYLLIHRILIQSNMILVLSRKLENITIRNPLKISLKRINDFGLSYSKKSLSETLFAYQIDQNHLRLPVLPPVNRR